MTPARMAEIHGESFTVPRPWKEAEFREMIGDATILVVASDDDGFALAREVAGEAELLTIAVATAARRQGVGRTLLETVLAMMVARGAEALFLEVASGNDAAIGLYTGAGFREAGRRRAYYDGITDALIYRKDLK